MLIKKFYDSSAADTAGGETAVVESPAAIMAKHGQLTDENTAFKPIEIKEVKEVETKVEEATPDAKSEETKPAEKPASETQETKSQGEEQKKEEKQPIVAESPKVQTLDEVLKNNQPDTVLKALGFDDEKVALISEMKDIDPKVVGIIQAYKNGTLGDYTSALSTDYTKMSDVDVMRNQLRKEYPKVSDAAFEALFEDEVLDKYKLDSETYSEAEVTKGKLLLEAKAAKYRDELITNQEKYLMPKPPEPKPEIKVDNTAEIQAKENVEKYVKGLLDDPYTKDIVANKKITIGEGDEKFSYPVDHNALIGNLSDGEKWASVMYDKETGKQKTAHQLLIATVAEYGMDFLNAYALHFKGLGGKEVIEPIENASKPNNEKAAKGEDTSLSPAAKMAKEGTYTGGGSN